MELGKMARKLISVNEEGALVDSFDVIRELEREGLIVGTGNVFIYDDNNFNEAHELSREIRKSSAKLLKKNGSGEMLDLYRRTLLFDAPYDFDCAFRYAEWNRPREKRFYEPRRKQLMRAANAMTRLEKREIKRLLLMMPPGVGKTTLAIGFLVWSGMRNPDLSILGVSNNNDFLRGTYDEVLRFLDPEGEYLWGEIFPGIRVVNTNAAGLRIDLKTKKRFQTFEFGSTETKLAGRFRATNLIYCDDLVGNLEEAMNYDRMEKLWGAYSTDVRQRGQGDFAELIIQTPWSLHDPIDRLESMYRDDPLTEIIRFPALDENDESNFDYPYGVGFTTEQYHQQRELMDDVTWKAVFMCSAIEREGQLYPPDELQRYFDLPDREPDVIFAVCDTKETGPDFCAMPIVYKYGEDYYIDKWICDNSNPDILEERIASLLTDRKVKLARFESNRGGTMFAKSVQDKVKEKGGFTKITTKWNQANKDTRIITRAGWIKAHCLFKDESLYPKDKEYRTAMDMMTSYNMGGKNKHDDVPDVLADLADYVESMSIASVKVIKRAF